MLSNIARHPNYRLLITNYWDSLLLFLSFLALYIFTLSLDILPADSGEYQVVVPLLGVAHPPGFSLYTLLGKLFITLIRVGTYAYRLNLFSAFISSLTLILVNRAVYRLAHSSHAPHSSLFASRLPGLLAAFTLGVSTTFWSQATTTNIRSLMALLTALAVYALVEYRLNPTVNRLAFFAFTLSLAVVHHLSIAFIAIVLVFAAILFAPSPRHLVTPKTLLQLSVSALTPLIILLYLPIRGAAHAFLAPPGLDTLSGFFQHVLGLGFGGDFFYFANFAAIPDRLAILLNIFLFQFNAATLILLTLGLILSFFRDWKLALALTLAFAVHCFVAITYRAPQTVEYLLPAYVILVIMAAGGLPLVAGNSPIARRLSSIVFHCSLFIAALFVFLRNLPAYLYLAHDTSTRDYAESALTLAPPNAVILSSWHYATAMWYLQQIEGKRLDVDVQYIFPQGTSLAQNWVDRINANMPNRPTLITNFYPQEYAGTPFRFAPVGLLWQAFPDPLTGEFFGFDPGDGHPHDGGWIMLNGGPFGSTLTPGEMGHAITMWQAPANPTPINFFVQLLGPDGLLYGQMDVPHSQIAPNEVIVDRYDITPNTDTQPGEYRLVAGAYLPDGARLAPDFTDLATVTVIPRDTPPATRHPQPFGLLAGYDFDFSIPDSPRLYLHWRLDGQLHELTLGNHTGSPLQTVTLPALTGYITTAVDLPHDWQTFTVTEPDRSSFIVHRSSFPSSSRYISFGPLVLVGSTITKESDGSYHVDLRWLADRPITDDLIVKVDLVGENYTWRDQSDSVPAGGAIPTLKWIPGIVIHDRHRLKMLQPTPATFQLVVYDHFTQRNLPILDSRLAILGPTIPLGSIQP